MPQAQPTHHPAGVNPLLYAATTAQNSALGTPGAATGFLHPNAAAVPHTPGTATPSAPGQRAIPRPLPDQTPTRILYAKAPEFFSEWKDVGLYEAHFLGAQILAKTLFFGVPAGETERRFMTRSDYNEMGPSGIHDFVFS